MQTLNNHNDDVVERAREVVQRGSSFISRDLREGYRTNIDHAAATVWMAQATAAAQSLPDDLLHTLWSNVNWARLDAHTSASVALDLLGNAIRRLSSTSHD